jgi:predicted secreted protein
MWRLKVACLALLLAPPAAAQLAPPAGISPQPYNVVSLQAEAQREVDNDLMSAVLYVELSEPDAARLAQSLNTAINAALKAAQGFKAVRTRSGAYQTYPVYDKQRKLSEWRGRAELRIESADFAAVSALIGRLQSGLQVGSIAFAVSPELRQRLQDELMPEAIAAFRARAQLAQKALGGRAYKIRQVNINTGFVGRPQPMLMESSARTAAVAPPQFEGGTSRVTVTANGSIEVD